MEELKELKNCPFCGGHNLEVTNTMGNGISNVTCLDCYATGGLGFTLIMAKENWNRRANNDKL